MTQVFTLPNRLRILVEELPHTHSISIGCFVGAGAGHEERRVAGISHFVEHMIFKGSARYPTPQLLADAIESVGGILDAYTDFDATVYYAKVADIHFGHALDVLTDMLLRPCFDPKQIEQQRRVVIEEIRQTQDTPSDLVHTLLDQAMWGDQPLGRDIAGVEESVAGLTREDMLDYWRRHYTASNMIITVAGNVEAARAVDAIQEALADLTVGEPCAFLSSRPPQPGPDLLVSVDDSAQASFGLGFPGIPQHDPDRWAIYVFNTVQGGGMASRLFQKIREERGLAYNIGSYSRQYHDAGKWLVYGSVDPERLHECLATVMGELRDVLRDGITERELRRVKEQVKGGIMLLLEDTWSVAERNGSYLMRYGKAIPVEQVVAEVEAVTCEDVRRVASRVLRADQMHLAVIGPNVDESALRGELTLY